MSTPAPAPASVPPQGLTRSHLSDGEWHRLHPLTPLLKGGVFLLVLIGILVANLRERLVFLFAPGLAPEGYAEQYGGDPIDWVIANNLYLVVILVVLGVVILVTVAFYVSWRFHTFRITGDAVEVRSGILFRTNRRAPLDRVQGVNLVRPMIARLLGAAKLEVVGAGADGNVKLEYLSTVNAETVRADILRLASGRKLGAASAPGREGMPGKLVATVGQGVTGLLEGDDQDHEAPESVVHIPVGRILLAQLLSVLPSLIIIVPAMIVGFSFAGFWALFGLIPVVLALGGYWVGQVLKSMRYSIAPTRDGARVTFGFFTTITETLPPGRVHAVSVSQPLLWRPFKWWRITITRLSGAGAGDAAAQAAMAVVLPVGTPADTERVLSLLLPGIDDAERAFIVRAAGKVGSPDGVAGDRVGFGDGAFSTTPRRAAWLRPFSWRRNGFLLTEDALLMRRGVLSRTMVVLPLARVQSLSITQGPIDRALRVANVQGQTVTGPVTASLGILDRDAVIELFDGASRAVVAAAEADHTHRWAADEPEDAVLAGTGGGFTPPPPYVPLPSVPAGGSAPGTVSPPPYVVPPPSVTPPPYVPMGASAPAGVAPPPFVPPAASAEVTQPPPFEPPASSTAAPAPTTAPAPTAAPAPTTAAPAPAESAGDPERS